MINDCIERELNDTELNKEVCSQGTIRERRLVYDFMIYIVGVS